MCIRDSLHLVPSSGMEMLLFIPSPSPSTPLSRPRSSVQRLSFQEESRTLSCCVCNVSLSELLGLRNCNAPVVADHRAALTSALLALTAKGKNQG
eukprot:8096620-Pyramimonas_sp.AAC.1